MVIRQNTQKTHACRIRRCRVFEEAAIEVDFFLRHKHTNNYAINTRAYLLLADEDDEGADDEVVSYSRECWSDLLQ